VKHISSEKMDRAVRYLWELSQLYKLSPCRLAPFIGVDRKNIYRWFRGTRPVAAHKALILEAIRKIEREFSG
jgi:predicted transcriptional regulator